MVRILSRAAAAALAIFLGTLVVTGNDVDALPNLARRDAVSFDPHHLVPSQGSAAVRLKSYSYDPASKTFSGEVWVQNINFNKLVEVYWSSPDIKWSATNTLKANYVSTNINNYEVWSFRGAAPGIDFGSQFYLKYSVNNQTFYDSNGGAAFNYLLETVPQDKPVTSDFNTCVGNGIQRKLYTSGSRYLVAEVLSDAVVHFEVSEKRRPNPNLHIFNSPMVDEENFPKRFCGPTSFVDNGNVIETPSVKVTIDAGSLSATVFDKIKNQVLTTYSYANLASGDINSFKNPTNLVLQWSREKTESVYGIAITPGYDGNGNSEGNWATRALVPPKSFQGDDPGFGNTMVTVQEGAMVYAQFPIVYSQGSDGYQHAFFLDDQHRLEWDLTQPTQKVTSRGSRALRWFAIAGSSLNDLRKTYLKIVGLPVVPPKSALGLQISKYGYKTWGEANFEIDGIVNKNLPLDAVIFDLYWFGGFNNFGNLAWDNTNFPNPTKNLRDFRAKGPGTILIEEPYIQKDTATFNFLRDQGALAKRPSDLAPTYQEKWWGSGSYVDHSAPNSKYWAQCKRCKLIAGCITPPVCPSNLPSTGASEYILGHWQDLGEPEIFEPEAVYAGIREDDGFTLTTHRSVANLYQFLKTKKTFELYKDQSLLRRPVSLTRTSAPGLHRYGALTWSGDIPAQAQAAAASFGSKKHAIMGGMEYHSSDVGGFHRKGCKDGCDVNKLYTVWMASSAWLDLPIKPHVNAKDDYAVSFTASPSAVGDFGSNKFNIQTRYFLLPLYYSLAHQASRNGETIITPLFLRYPDDKNVRSNGNQYLVGPIMVPFTSDTNTQGRGVYLPANTEWYHFHTHQRIVGTGGYTQDLTYYPFGGSTFTLPALVQAGSIFPTNYVDEKTRNTRFQDRKDNSIVYPFQVRVYPGPKSTFTATDDDGETQAYSNSGAYSTTELSQELNGSTVTVNVAAAKGYFPGQNTRRQLIVEIVIPAGFSGVSSVTIDGQAVAVNPAASAVDASQGYKLYGINNRIVGIYGPVSSIFKAKTVVATFN
ncbi:hypothetical protein HDU97_006356 [Phlyctochytrium planicorne]|nr:hypothetical protein HDU97_006356 [Phlyctochytrium planicorne]